MANPSTKRSAAQMSLKTKLGRMTWRSRAAYGLLIIVGVWIALQAAFDFFDPRPEAQNPHMQMAPYREGMSLRQAFESLPRYGADSAQLRVLHDNNLAWAARWELLRDAKSSIDVSYFILKQDVFGVAFLGHLLQKAKQGVKIRILLDAFGTKMSWHPEGNDYLDALVNTGNVEVRMYRPLLKRLAEGTMHLSLAVTVASDHDKILVVDGQRAITGGRNIATEYFSHPDDAEMVFRDVGVEIRNERVAAAMTSAFEAQYNSEGADAVARERLDLQSQERDLEWAYQLMDGWLSGKAASNALLERLQKQGLGWADELAEMKHLKGALAKPLPAYVRAEARVLDSTTRFNVPNDVISQGAARLVKSARKEIFIQNPYIMVSDETVNLFAEASQHDVPIILFTNSPASADSAISQAIFLEQWPHLLARIPTLKLYGNGEDQMVHAKLATFDNIVSLVGTYNLSPLSMATNSELVIAVWSPEFARMLTTPPREKLAQGEPHAYRYRIATNSDGSPRYDDDGEPIPEFGPEDHTDIHDQKMLQAVRKTVQAVDALPGVSPFF